MSLNLAKTRIQRELNQFQKVKDYYQFEVNLINSNIFSLKAKVFGPPETPYTNGIYYLEFKLNEKYPFTAPSVKFLTRIWHPNISSVTGVICLDILKDKWSASMSLRSILISILTLLQEPIPNDPQDGQVAKQLLNNKKQFEDTANYWKLYFADNLNSEQRSILYPEYEKKLIDFKNETNVKKLNKSEAFLLGVLSSNNWNIKNSVNSL